jgi:hypothetical protein
VGKTPLMKLPVALGAHDITLRLGEHSVSGRLVVSDRRADKLTWTVGESTWRLDFSHR